MSSTEVVYPDAVSMGGKQTAVNEPWMMLNPCPMCGVVPHDSPEGTHPDGTPRWVFPHCWKCGFRPGVNTAADMQELRRQFEAFVKFQNDNRPEHPSLQAPQSAEEADQLRALLAEYETQSQITGGV